MRTRTGITVNGFAVRALRDALGYDIPTFAKAVGVSVPFMSRIERNLRQPSPMVRARMVEVLGVPLNAITMHPDELKAA
jgi:transcriptional regulator with XRE-family HTH domain